MPQLEVPAVPFEASRAWDAFVELHWSRPTGMGLSAISFSEILAYQEIMSIRLELWEVRLLRRIDLAYLKARAAEDTSG